MSKRKIEQKEVSTPFLLAVLNGLKHTLPNSDTISVPHLWDKAKETYCPLPTTPSQTLALLQNSKRYRLAVYNMEEEEEEDEEDDEEYDEEDDAVDVDAKGTTDTKQESSGPKPPRGVLRHVTLADLRRAIQEWCIDQERSPAETSFRPDEGQLSDILAEAWVLSDYDE